MRVSPIAKLFLVFPIACLPVVAQKPTPTPERPREIVALLNDARLAEPELTVDTLLRLVAGKKIKDPVWARDLLEEALRSTDDVKYRVRKHRVYRGTGIVDTVSGYMEYAYDQRLDELSLKARTIEILSGHDKTRAKQVLFQMNGDIPLKPLTCDDALGYEPAAIYEAVRVVASGSFTAKEIEEGLRALFVLPWIENMNSPSQVAGALNLIWRLKSPTAERRLLSNAFERAISRNFNDDRSFSGLFSRGTYQMSMPLNDHGEDVLVGWREFLKKNSAGPRCLDSKPSSKEVLPEPINSFNLRFEEKDRFRLEDFESVEYRGQPNDKLYLNSENNKKISAIFRAARQAKKNAGADNKAAELEWQLRVSEMIEALDSWKSDENESESEVFNQKAVFFRVLLPEIDDATMRQSVSRAFMRFLSNSNMQKESFIEWLYHARWFASEQKVAFESIAGEFPNANFNVISGVAKLGI